MWARVLEPTYDGVYQLAQSQKSNESTERRVNAGKLNYVYHA